MNQESGERNDCVFVFDIENIHFNKLGEYILDLSIQSSFSAEYVNILRQIRIQRNAEHMYINGNRVSTEAIVQETEYSDISLFYHKFTFFLPESKINWIRYAYNILWIRYHRSNQYTKSYNGVCRCRIFDITFL